MKPGETITFFMPIQCSHDIHLIARIHPTLRIETGFQQKNHYLKVTVTNLNDCMFHIKDRLFLTAMKSTDQQERILFHKGTSRSLSSSTIVHNIDTPPLNDWRNILQDLFPKTVPNTTSPFLRGIADPRFALDKFHLHFEQGLQHGNFPTPLITQAEVQDVDEFVRACIEKGIIEVVPEPTRLVLHPTILIPKKKKADYD